MNLSLKYLAALSALAACAATHAAETRTTMSVSMTVPISCTVSATAMSFGTNNPATTSAQSQSSISVNCPSGAAYNVALDVGTHGNNRLRNIQNTADPTQTIPYILYRDAARTQRWGDSDFAFTADGSSVAGTGSGANQTLTVYGLTGVVTGRTAGTYTDSVTVTVLF